MKWDQLSKIQRALLMVFVFAVAFLVPEFLMILDVGGIELAASLIMLNLLNIKTWCLDKIDRSKDFAVFVIKTVGQTHFARQHVMAAHYALAMLSIGIGASISLSLFVFLLPVLWIDVSTTLGAGLY